MKLTLNGQEIEITSSVDLQSLIDKYCAENRRIVAEVNGEVIQSLLWQETQLQDGDKVELVSLVGGG